MGKTLLENKEQVNLGDCYTFTSLSPKYGENITFATEYLVLDHKNEKNNS